jgi:hypothetical protein
MSKIKNSQGLKLDEQREYRAMLWRRSSRVERLCSVAYYEIEQLRNIKRGLKKLCKSTELKENKQGTIQMLHFERIELIASIKKHLNELNDLCPEMYLDLIKETEYIN